MDANAKYTWIYFLKRKKDAIIAFRQLHKLIENQFSTKLKALQIDGGGSLEHLVPISVNMLLCIDSHVLISHTRMVVWKENTGKL